MVRRTLGPLLAWDAAEHEAAYERAETLLRDSLAPEQYEFYQRRGYIELPSRLYPQRTYRVDGWRPIAVFEEDRFVGAICLRPREHLPGPDVVLARKLLIEGAEEDFLRAGNWLSPAWRPASAAPMILLCLLVLAPFLYQLPQYGPAGLGFGALFGIVPLFVAWRIGRRRRGPERQEHDGGAGDEAAEETVSAG